jgi:hypothetical protein
MFKGNWIFSDDPAKTNTDRSEITLRKPAGILADRSYLFRSFWRGLREGLSSHVTKPNVATRTARLRLSSAEADHLSETRLLNHTLKDNVEKGTADKLETLTWNGT